MTQLTLKMLRVRNNWPQEQVAKKIGVSKETWSNWENYKTYPDIPKLKKLRQCLKYRTTILIF